MKLVIMGLDFAKTVTTKMVTTSMVTINLVTIMMVLTAMVSIVRVTTLLGTINQDMTRMVLIIMALM